MEYSNFVCINNIIIFSRHRVVGVISSSTDVLLISDIFVKNTEIEVTTKSGRKNLPSSGRGGAKEKNRGALA